MTVRRFALTIYLRRGTMRADFRVFAIMRPCFDYKFDSIATATLARAMVSVIHGGGRTRL
jgi:hypothetical protein